MKNPIAPRPRIIKPPPQYDPLSTDNDRPGSNRYAWYITH